MMRRLASPLVVLVAVGSLAVLGAGPATARGRARVPDPIRVLVVGESQAGTLAVGAPRPPDHHGLVAQPGLALWDSTILGCSISSVPTFVLADGEHAANRCGGTGYWQQYWTTAVERTKPDVVFVMAGARDLYDVAAPGGGVIHPGDPVWTAQYTADVRRAVPHPRDDRRPHRRGEADLLRSRHAAGRRAAGAREPRPRPGASRRRRVAGGGQGHRGPPARS